MKAFEEQFPKPQSKPGMHNDNPLSWWLEKKEGWEAALEWFYDKLDHSIEHKELKDLIEEELEEE